MYGCEPQESYHQAVVLSYFIFPPTMKIYPPCIMSVQYTGGISLNTLGVFRTPKNIKSTLGDMLSTPGDVQYTGWMP